ncbi:MAG: DNA primase [Desulfobacterales bacterium C00003060]|nr:MAG: DNA primase [Desulfobacterales bacterium C00003060]
MAGFIPEDIISHIRDVANIVDVISEYVTLKKAGRNFIGLCPFHADKKPSFTVSEEKQIFQCFGCGKGGNVYTFLMEYNNLSFPETVGFLAQKYGIEIPTRKMSPTQKKELEEKKRLVRINREAADYFRENLANTFSGGRARDYLNKRQMTSAVMDRFVLGYAPKSWTGLTQHFSRKGVPLDDLQKAGLVVAKNRKYYDRFRDRVIFPIIDIHQEVVGFGGRSLDDSLPKYLNSPDTPVYHKSRTLYGLHVAKDACRRVGSVFIVEGYFDLLALHCHGIQNVVATLGTALTRQHVRIMKGYASRICLVFDSDEPGIKAAERSLSLFLEEKVDASILILPEGKDPDSYVFDVGADRFLKATEKALGLIPFLIESAIKKHGISLEGKVRIIETLKGTLGSLRNCVSRSVYIRDLAERLDIDESAILEHVRASATRDKKVNSLPKPRHSSRIEEALVATMLQCPEMVSGFDGQEIIEGFETVELKKIGRMILERSSLNLRTGADLIAQTDDEQLRNMISSLLMEDIHVDCEGFQIIVRQYQARLRKRRIRLLSNKIKEAEKTNDQKLLNQLLAEKQRWARQHLDALA